MSDNGEPDNDSDIQSIIDDDLNAEELEEEGEEAEEVEEDEEDEEDESDADADIDLDIKDTKIKVIPLSDRIRLKMSNYEYASILAYRAQQLAEGSLPYVNVDNSMSYNNIALLELNEKLLPFKINRIYPGSNINNSTNKVISIYDMHLNTNSW